MILDSQIEGALPPHHIIMAVLPAAVPQPKMIPTQTMNVSHSVAFLLAEGMGKIETRAMVLAVTEYRGI